MKMIFDDFKTLVEPIIPTHGTSLHLNSYLVSVTPYPAIAGNDA
jgi:hypothetical protein